MAAITHFFSKITRFLLFLRNLSHSRSITLARFLLFLRNLSHSHSVFPLVFSHNHSCFPRFSLALALGVTLLHT